MKNRFGFYFFILLASQATVLLVNAAEPIKKSEKFSFSSIQVITAENFPIVMKAMQEQQMRFFSGKPMNLSAKELKEQQRVSKLVQQHIRESSENKAYTKSRKKAPTYAKKPYPTKERASLVGNNNSVTKNRRFNKFVLVKSGQFIMGDAIGKYDEKDELPAHAVKVSKFYLAKYEVTRGEFERFVKSTRYVTDSEKGNSKLKCGSGMANKPANISWRNPGFPQTDGHPVVCISFNDAKKYIAWLSKQDKKQYRLPSEAEWEYSARAGSTTEFSFGNSENQLCRYGNHTKHPDLSCGDRYRFTAPVGKLMPNKLGLHDIHGNAREWTQDCWNSNYFNAPKNGKAWKTGNCKAHPVRGGGWLGYPIVSRSAFRSGSYGSAINLGFRLAYTK